MLHLVISYHVNTTFEIVFLVLNIRLHNTFVKQFSYNLFAYKVCI